ncbi:MAG: 50S ribosomal protein L5 [Verrucomicrobia bacterium]|nr:50S ribosomal protein L5 [Verrucomicrobiota bacterium]
MSRLKDRYLNVVVPKLKADLKIENPMRLPRLKKVVINMGIGIVDKDQFQAHVDELGRIAGQRPQIARARTSISNFKLREGMNIGSKVTLRGTRMYEFLDRLINAALPRIRDFRGLSASAFDAQGNYTIGIKEQTIFPEVDPNNVGATQGMDITIVMDCRGREEARLLLEGLGVPFAKA